MAITAIHAGELGQMYFIVFGVENTPTPTFFLSSEQ